MGNKRIISASIDEDLYSEVREAANEVDMSLSEWITDRISDGTNDSNTLTGEEVINMDWNEKIDVVDAYGLDVDPDDYDGNDDELAEVICDELGLEYPINYEEPISAWLLVIPFVGLAVWGISRFFKRKQSE